jgi:enamine deaminase RidA (YjgF/YER057c/UK114 family)
MNDQKILSEDAIVLPEPPQPRGNYSAVVQQDSLLFVSGQLPLRNGELIVADWVPRWMSPPATRQRACAR